MVIKRWHDDEKVNGTMVKERWHENEKSNDTMMKKRRYDGAIAMIQWRKGDDDSMVKTQLGLLNDKN
jgi:hypothetical protein